MIETENPFQCGSFYIYKVGVYSQPAIQFLKKKMFSFFSIFSWDGTVRGTRLTRSRNLLPAFKRKKSATHVYPRQCDAWLAQLVSWLLSNHSVYGLVNSIAVDSALYFHVFSATTFLNISCSENRFLSVSYHVELGVIQRPSVSQVHFYHWERIVPPNTHTLQE